MPSKPALLAIHIGDKAFRLGFDLVGIVPVAPPYTAARYRAWLENNYHGDMAYLARPDALAKREDLDRVLPGVRSVVVIGANYHVRPLPPDQCDDPARGVVASYAWGEDYHEVLLPRLRELAASVEDWTGQPVASRAHVDTGPVLERDLAARAGLGFVGKNTNLIQPRLGSWLFLAELLLAMELPRRASLRLTTCSARPDLLIAAGRGSIGDPAQQLEVRSPKQGTCGGCTRCLDACPTSAFVAPYVLDARRCISYLTIERKGPIPTEFRPLIGNRIFGCDICQEVCPWNRRFARPTTEPAFQPGPDRSAPFLLDLMTLDDAGFRDRFRTTPLIRSKRRGLLRNAAVALGNWGDPAAVSALVRALHDHEPLIRGHAAWALGRVGSEEARHALADAMTAETDGWVRAELVQALQADLLS
jgi:epoxyqueuosine reductase